MTDISDLREGDEIEVVVRARIGKPTSWAKDRQTAHLNDGSFSKSFTVVRPEIIPGQPYVAADGELYMGRAGDVVVGFDELGPHWYADHGIYDPLPAGLRPAKVVPE